MAQVGEILVWEDRPSWSSVVGGLGCASGLVVLGLAGLWQGLHERDGSSLCSLPLLLVLIAGAAALGLACSRVELDPVRGELRRSRSLVGRLRSSAVLPLGRPERVRIEPLSAAGRVLYRVVVEGEHRIDVWGGTDLEEAGKRADEVAACLGVPRG